MAVIIAVFILYGKSGLLKPAVDLIPCGEMLDTGKLLNDFLSIGTLAFKTEEKGVETALLPVGAAGK